METMKSAFFVTIFLTVGGVAILLASSVEDQRAAIEFREARAEFGLPPQIDDEKLDADVTLQPPQQYSTVHAKPRIATTSSRHRHVARRHLNFFEKLMVSFVNLQKHQPAKTASKRRHTTSPRG
jgi:hypothetical protein